MRVMQARYKHNIVTREDADVGTFFTISVDNPLHVTLTHAALDSTCRALAWWRNVAAGDDSSVLYRHAAAADNAVVLTRVHNAVGERLEMWMDFGDRSIVGHLQEGVRDLLQPLVRPVPRPRLLSGAEESHKPSMVLCVTLEHLVLVRSSTLNTHHSNKLLVSLAVESYSGVQFLISLSVCECAEGCTSRCNDTRVFLHCWGQGR